MYKLLLSCVVTVALMATSANCQSLPTNETIENLVNTTIIQMNYDIKYFDVLAAELVKSFNEKLAVVQFIQNITDLKYHDSRNKLNRMLIPTNQSRDCVILHRPNIKPLSSVTAGISACIESAQMNSAWLLTQVNSDIRTAKSNIDDIQSNYLGCMNRYPNDPVLALDCVERYIEPLNFAFQENLNNIELGLEKASTDAMYLSKAAQQCAFLAAQKNSKNIDTTLANINNCISLNSKNIAKVTLQTMLKSLSSV